MTPRTLKQRVEALERDVIAEALRRHRWNRTRVADELGLSRVGLANKLRRYGLMRADGSRHDAQPPAPQPAAILSAWGVRWPHCAYGSFVNGRWTFRITLQ
jgi:hypothetical protein